MEAIGKLLLLIGIFILGILFEVAIAIGGACVVQYFCPGFFNLTFWIIFIAGIRSRYIN